MKTLRHLFIRLRVWQLHRRADALLKAHQRNKRAARRQSDRAHRQWLTAITLRGHAERLRREAA
jgi:hypothetical protein